MLHYFRQSAAMDKTERFRESYRQTQIGPGYQGWAHFAFTTGVCSLIIAGCLWRLQDVSVWEWLTVPITLVFANLVEPFGHRKAMHHRVRGLGLLFERHAGQHHRFFQPGRMAYDSSRDFKAVLFPPVLIVFFFGAFALPVGLLIAAFGSANVGYLFVASAIGYFLNYELLHFAWHMREDSWVFRVPGMRALRRVHHTHHHPELMSHYNFNVTYPLADWLHGTYHPGPDRRPADPAPKVHGEPGR